MTDIWVLLPTMLVMSQIDWTKPENVLYVRVLYCLAQLFSLAVSAYIYQQITQKHDQRNILVAPAASFGQAAAPAEEQTVEAYDTAQLKKAAMQILTGTAIVGVIHLKFGMIQPLFMQTIMNPMQLVKSPLFQIFVLGKKGEVEERPFKEPVNPLMSALSGLTGQPDPAAAAANVTPAPVAISDEADSKTGDNEKRQRKAQKPKKAE